MRLRQLIINADDAGIDPARNRGIEEAFGAGVVTSATVLAMGLAFGECVPPASSRAVRGGFVAKQLLWARARAGELDGAEIEHEFRAQLDRVLDAGIEPTHVDGHNHVHVFPSAREALDRMTADYPCVGVRRRPFEFDLGETPSAKREYFRALASAPVAARTTTCFAGFCLERDFSVARVIEVLRACPGGSLELMVHPGRCTADSVAFSADPGREFELASLVEPALGAWIRSAGIALVHFGTLSDSSGTPHS